MTIFTVAVLPVALIYGLENCLLRFVGKYKLVLVIIIRGIAHEGESSSLFAIFSTYNNR
jgi:hypothetical protein